MEIYEEQLSLKWRNFRSSLTEGFHDFLREEMMVDVTLAAEGKFVQAHKLILSVCSPYFKNLFEVNPCKHPIVILKDVGHNELSDMLQFMYKGEVGVRQEDLPSFLKLADTLKVKGLVREEVENEKERIARVRKKKDKFSDVDKENTECESLSDKTKEKKVIRGRKRRLSTKGTTKKAKKEKSSDEQVTSVCVTGSDDEDDNPLVKLVSDKVKSGDSVEVSECRGDDKSGFSDTGVGNERVKEEDSLDHRDEFNVSPPGFYNPENSSEADQSPQGHVSSVIISRAPRAFVWDYFLKETHQAICLNCGKTFKGQRPNTICEQHLKRRHPEFYKILLEKKIKRAELHMNPMVVGLGIPSFDHD